MDRGWKVEEKKPAKSQRCEIGNSAILRENEHAKKLKFRETGNLKGKRGCQRKSARGKEKEDLVWAESLRGCER